MTATSRAARVARTLVMPKPAPVPWARMLRAGMAVPAPFVLGIAIGKPGDGLLASIGTIPALMADRGGPYRLRALRMGLTIAASATGFLIGGAVRGDGWVAVVVVAAVAMFSGVVSSIGARSSIASLNLLIYTAISSARVFPGALWWPSLLVAAGGAWVMALSLSFWAVAGTQAERDAVAETYDALAALLDAIGTPAAEDARRTLTQRINEADDAIMSGRVTSGGTDRRWHRLLAALNAVGPLAEATTPLLRRRQPVDPALPAAARHLAEAVRTGRTPMDPLYGAAPANAEAWVTAWRHAAAAIGAGHARLDDPISVPPRPLPERARAVFEGPLTAPESWLSAVRLTVCVAVASLLRELVIQDRSYWIVLSVAVIMKPDFGSVFARAVQRSAGTAVGVVIGGIVMTAVPGQWGLVPFIAVFAALLPVTLVRNYGMFSAFLTPLVLILIDALAPAPGHLIANRLGDTLLGAGIVLVFGYVLWPETWRPNLGRRFADAVTAVGDYLLLSLGPAAGEAAPSGGAGAARRRAYRRLSDLRTLLQQGFADPATAGRQAEALWPAAVALERLCDGVAAVAASVQHGAPPPSPADVKRVAAGLRALGDAAAGRRPPPPLALPREGQLASLSDELDSARAAIRRAARRRLSRPLLRV